VETLTKHRKQLDLVAKKLLEQETIDADEFVTLVGLPKAKPELKLAVEPVNGELKK
jgi:ATP-dependent Zn protease